jgi:sugar phosphate isomerase/epimerase
MATDLIKTAVVASVFNDEPREAARAARLIGFSGLIFDAYGPRLALPELSRTGRREFRHILSSHDQQLVGLRFDLGPKGLGPGADVDRILSRLDAMMESSKEMQAPLICVDVGPLPAPPRPHQSEADRLTSQKLAQQQAGAILLPSLSDLDLIASPAPAPQPPAPGLPIDTSQIDHALMELGQRADSYGVILAMRSQLSGFDALERALRQASCPWFGIDLDPVAILHDPWPIDRVFDQLGPLVRHVRGRDATVGADRRTQPAAIGRGSTDWPYLLALLDDAGYNGWITVDSTELIDRPAAARLGLDHLRTPR